MEKRLFWPAGLLSIIVVILLMLPLYGQAPTPTKPSNEPKTETKNSSKKTQTIQPGPQNSSPSRILQVTPQAKQEATDTTNKQDNHASGDWWIRLFTGVLAFVAVLQIITFWVQTHWMYKALNATKETAEAVKIQADTMGQELALKRRSKIHVRDVATPGIENPLGRDECPHGQLSIVNLGGMPANIIEIGAWFEIGREKGLPTEMPDESEKPNVPNPQPAKLEVGQSVRYKFADERRPWSYYDPIRTKPNEDTLYVIGYAKYTDATQLPRYSRFFREYRLPKEKTGLHRLSRRFFPVEGYEYEE